MRFHGSEHFLSILTLKVPPNNYDSIPEITFSKSPMPHNVLRRIS